MSTALTGAMCKGRGLVKVKMEEENRGWVLLRAWRFAEKKELDPSDESMRRTSGQVNGHGGFQRGHNISKGLAGNTRGHAFR